MDGTITNGTIVKGFTIALPYNYQGCGMTIKDKLVDSYRANSLEPAKFRRDSKIKWYRTKVDKDLLGELMKTSDLHGLRQVICQLGLFFVTGLLANSAAQKVSTTNWFWSMPLLIIALFVHGTNGPFMGLVAVHELCHKTPFRTKALNEFFLKLYAFISWSDYVWFRPSHVKHHQLTVHEDYDGEVVLPMTISMKDWKFWLGLLAWDPAVTWTTLRVTYERATGHILSGDRGKDPSWYQHILPDDNLRLRKEHRNWSRTLLLGHAIAAAVFIGTGNWFLVVVFTFGTQYCGWLGFLCGVPQHFGLSSNVPDWRLCCRTYTCSWLPAFYYWNMQYHVEHHMFPAVPFYNLPRLRKAIIHDLPFAPHGLWNTWSHMLAVHKAQLADPTYTFVPELPGSTGHQVSDSVVELEALLAT